MNWTTGPPTEAGFYWFYGDNSLGGMGIDFTDEKKLTLEMCLAHVTEIRGGTLIVTNGRFVGSNTFDPKMRREGHLGYWAKADIPEQPEDVNHLFTKEL